MTGPLSSSPPAVTDRGRESPATARRARRGRLLSVVGGALMAATFFLPAIRSCGSDIVPAGSYAEALGEAAQEADSVDVILYLILWTSMLLVAYLVGTLLAIAAAARLARCDRLRRRLGNGVVGILLLTASGLLCFYLYDVLNGVSIWPTSSDWLAFLALVVGPLVTLVYLWFARRPTERLHACAAFLAAFWMFCWFGGWIWIDSGSVRYGLYLSFAASCILLIGAVGEARAVTRQSWRRTLGQLLIGRLARSRPEPGICPQCEYSLYGLTQMRCPECGREFTAEEAGEVPAAPEAARSI